MGLGERIRSRSGSIERLGTSCTPSPLRAGQYGIKDTGQHFGPPGVSPLKPGERRDQIPVGGEQDERR